MMQLQVAVASDLHAFAELKGRSSPSHLQVSLPEDQPNRHPISGLLALISRERLNADLFLCPGDIGDKASPEGIQYAWRKLQEVKNALRADVLAITTGNHDVDSRLQHSSWDPETVLKSLVPTYPSPDEQLNDQYWARAFVIQETSSYRLLILNSSAYHGTGQIEKNHGRIDLRTLHRIGDYLQGIQPKSVNILLCHHHPQQHSELGLGAYDWMREGQELLDLLGCGRFGRWLVVHGHKHHPKLSYSSGGCASAIVFSAGSLSAVLYPELGTAARNQFYHLTIDLDTISEFGFVGRGRAWDWASARGWLPAAPNSGLPAQFGFGWREDPSLLADRIVGYVDKDFMNWRDLLNSAPELAFLIPKDLELLFAELAAKHSIQVTRDAQSSPIQVGRAV